MYMASAKQKAAARRNIKKAQAAQRRGKSPRRRRSMPKKKRRYYGRGKKKRSGPKPIHLGDLLVGTGLTIREFVHPYNVISYIQAGDYAQAGVALQKNIEAHWMSTDAIGQTYIPLILYGVMRKFVGSRTVYGRLKFP